MWFKGVEGYFEISMRRIESSKGAPVVSFFFSRIRRNVMGQAEKKKEKDFNCTHCRRNGPIPTLFPSNTHGFSTVEFFGPDQVLCMHEPAADQLRLKLRYGLTVNFNNSPTGKY